MKKEDGALTIVVPQELVPYGETVEDIARSIIMFVPGGEKMGKNAIGLAQLCIAHGLNPFNGEGWYIPGKGFMVGIKGHRRSARREIRKQGGTYSVEISPLSDVEKEKYGVPKNAIAYMAKVFDSITANEYVKNYCALASAGVKHETILSLIGSRPFSIGIGYAMPGDTSRMKPDQAARKRAEAEALQRKFNLPFGFADDDVEMNGSAGADRRSIEVNGSVGADGGEIETSWSIADDERNETPHIDASSASRSLYGDDNNDLAAIRSVDDDEDNGVYAEYEDEPEAEAPVDGEVQIHEGGNDQQHENVKHTRPYPLAVLKEGIAAKAKQYVGKSASDKQRGLLVRVIEQCINNHSADPSSSRRRLCAEIVGEESSKDIPGELVLAMLKDWLKPKKDREDRYIVDAMATIEIVKALSELDGQQEMEF